MKKILILLAFLPAMADSYCQEEKSAVVRNISVQEFKKTMETLKDEVVIDLRTPDEIRLGKIADAVEIDFRGAGFKPAIAALDRNKVYLLYCGSGGRSVETSALMGKMGFKKVYNLEGGFRSWTKHKMPFVTD